MKTSQEDQHVELIRQILGRHWGGEAKRQLGDGTGHCFGPCREGPAPKYGLQFPQSRVELELLSAASNPAASCQLKHVLLVDEIQIPELYETLSYSQSKTTILFFLHCQNKCVFLFLKDRFWVKYEQNWGYIMELALSCCVLLGEAGTDGRLTDRPWRGKRKKSYTKSHLSRERSQITILSVFLL